MMENAFYFSLKALFVLKVFFPDIFGHLEKWINKKGKVNLKGFDIINWKQIFTRRKK